MTKDTGQAVRLKIYIGESDRYESKDNNIAGLRAGEKRFQDFSWNFYINCIEWVG